MQINNNVKWAKTLIEKAIEGVRELQEKGSALHYNVAFSITMQPGELNDSETLSVLEALNSAVSKFDSNAQLALNLNVPMVNPQQAEFEKSVEAKMNAAIQLEQALTPKPKQLVGV